LGLLGVRAWNVHNSIISRCALMQVWLQTASFRALT
jgi:hypothetical protein